MWISSSSIKNRVSNRGRIDIFSRGSGWKASLLLLALASFSVCAASDTCELIKDGTCVAKKSDDLTEEQRKYIGIDGDKITWNATDKSLIELYSQACKDLSFTLIKPEDLDTEGKCEFSMHDDDCAVNMEWTKSRVAYFLSFYGGKDGKAQASLTYRGEDVNVELNGANLKCTSEGCKPSGDFCDFKTSSKDGDWCSFKFAFNKTGSCNGEIHFGTDYKLGYREPTTVAPTTTTTSDADYEKTTPGVDAAGLSPWIIAGIVVGVLILVAVVVGLLVFFLIRRRKRRGSPQNMVEKGNVENDPQCVSALSHTNTTQVAATNMKSGSEMVGEPSANEHKEDEERSKPASKVEVVKPMSQKKKKDNTYQSLAILQKEEAKNEPAPSPSPLPEENKPKRKLTPDELYEPLGDPMKAIPMHLSEKKISEKKISSKKQKKKVEEEAKNTPATPSPSRSSKKKKSEKKKKDDHYHRLSSLENEAKK